MGSGVQMDKIKNSSIKRSMTVTFILTISIISVLSGITIFWANQIQQKIQQNRSIIIKNPYYKIDENTGGYVLDMNENNVEWHKLNMGETVAYYGCYFAMFGLPVFYIIGGIGGAAIIYFHIKLRTPILQLQNGMKRIQDNDLDFHIEYDGEDELGQLCHSMEKMRNELRLNNRALWDALEQRKLLNTSVAHDLRTPITVLSGYLDYLEKNIPQDKITEEMLMETISFMQKAVLRLKCYVECVRDVERIENIEIKRESQNTDLLLKEIESNICSLKGDKKIVFQTDITLTSVKIDKSILFRVLENLLENAIRYMDKQITLKICQRETLFLLCVRDDGKGFSKKDLQQAVNMFYGNEKGNDHFGIGLGVCKLLCEKHGGFLQIGNNKSGGAYVTAAIDVF